jgi:hypothetical protein
MKCAFVGEKNFELYQKCTVNNKNYLCEVATMEEFRIQRCILIDGQRMEECCGR